MTVVIDEPRHRSYAAVFDCSDLAAGPLATVALPDRVSSGTHAFWATPSCLPGW